MLTPPLPLLQTIPPQQIIINDPQPLGPEPELPQPDPRLHGTLKTPQAQSLATQAIATEKPNVLDLAAEAIDRVIPGNRS